MNKSSVAPAPFPPILQRRATMNPRLNWPTTSIKPKSALESTRARAAVAFSSSAPKSAPSRSEDRTAGCGSCDCEKDLRSKYARHALVVRWRSNASDAVRPLRPCARPRPERLRPWMATTGQRQCQRSQTAHRPSEGELRQEVGVRGEIVSKLAPSPEMPQWLLRLSAKTSFGGFEVSSPSLSEESMAVVSSTTSVDDCALVANLRLSNVGIVVHFIRARAPRSTPPLHRQLRIWP
jgi:hypothetical protein